MQPVHTCRWYDLLNLHMEAYQLSGLDVCGVVNHRDPRSHKVNHALRSSSSCVNSSTYQSKNQAWTFQVAQTAAYTLLVHARLDYHWGDC